MMNRTPLAFALGALVLSAGACDRAKPMAAPQTPQTPAEICDGAKAQGIIDGCTVNSANPQDRNVDIRFAGATAYSVVLQQTTSEEALEKLQLVDADELKAAGLATSDVTFHRDRARKLLVTVAAISHRSEAENKVSRLIKFIDPQS